MIRLFVGIELPESIKAQLLELQKNLPGTLWRNPEKLHINLRFVGNIEEHVGEELLKELQYVRFPAFHIALKGIGYFATGDRPHHIWVGIDPDKAIREFQEHIDSAVKKAGAGNQDKFKFVPHVNIGKLNGTTLEEVGAYIAANNLFHTEDFLVDSFTLYQSIARDNGEGKYHRLIENYPLSLV